MTTRAVLGVGAASGVVFVLLAVLVPAALPFGDPVLYLEQIAGHDLGQRTVHLGYFLLGLPLTRVLPGPPEAALNEMSALFGGLCFFSLVLLGGRLLRSLPLGLLSGLVFLAHGLILPQTLLAEVYIVQAALFLLAAQFWAGRRPVAAGLLLGASCLVTSSGILCLPFFLLLRRRAGEWIPFLLAAAGLWTLLLFPHRVDFLHGPRGILVAATHPVRLLPAVLKEGKEFVLGFSFLLPWAAWGLWSLRREEEGRSWLLALGGLWLASFALGERFPDVPVQLPLYTLLCPVVVLGLRDAIRRRLSFRSALGRKARPVGTRRAAWTPVVLFVLCLGLSLGLAAGRAARQAGELGRFREMAARLGQQLGPQDLILARWGHAVLLEYDLFGHRGTGRVIDARTLSETPDAAGGFASRSLAEGRRVWLVSGDRSIALALEKAGYALKPRPELGGPEAPGIVEALAPAPL